MRATGDAKLFSNISATTAMFQLAGGRYVLTGSATWGGGNIALQMLGPDGSTWIPAVDTAGTANTLTTNGQQVMDLPPGLYRIAVTTATSVYASLVCVPTS